MRIYIEVKGGMVGRVWCAGTATNPKKCPPAVFVLDRDSQDADHDDIEAAAKRMEKDKTLTEIYP